MVFLHFPSKYTEEEVMLQGKYSKLRKKKKALEEMKDPKPEPEKCNPMKRQLDPKDAKEYARKLIQSGKVNIQAKLRLEKTTFKRPRTLERKILSTGRSEGHGGLTPSYSTLYPTEPPLTFEPFTPDLSSPAAPPTAPDTKPHYSSQGRFGPRKPSPYSSSNSSTNKYSDHNKASSHTDQDRARGPLPPHHHQHQLQNKPKRGPTIFIQAHNITEQILKEQFSKFGKILNLKLNNPSVGFITFEKVEIAELAIQEMNGMTLEDISFDVQFARRQPNMAHLINDASVSASWIAQASSQSLKSNFQDSRQQVVYDEP